MRCKFTAFLWDFKTFCVLIVAFSMGIAQFF